MRNSRSCYHIFSKTDAGGGRNEPVIKVAPQPDAHAMESEQDRSHDLGEDPSCGEAETKRLKLVDLPVHGKP